MKRFAEEIKKTGGNRGQNEDRHQPTVEMLQERKLEDVETDVPVEDGIGDSKRGAMEEAQIIFPLGRPAESRKDAEKDGDEEDEHGHRAIFSLPGRNVNQVILDDPVSAGGKAAGQIKIEEKDREEGNAKNPGHLQLRQEGDGKYFFVPDRLEPKPVRDHFHGVPKEKEQEEYAQEKNSSHGSAQGRKGFPGGPLRIHSSFSVDCMNSGERKDIEKYTKKKPFLPILFSITTDMRHPGYRTLLKCSTRLYLQRAVFLSFLSIRKKGFAVGALSR